VGGGCLVGSLGTGLPVVRPASGTPVPALLLDDDVLPPLTDAKDLTRGDSCGRCDSEGSGGPGEGSLLDLTPLLSATSMDFEVAGVSGLTPLNRSPSSGGAGPTSCGKGQLASSLSWDTASVSSSVSWQSTGGGRRGSAVQGEQLWLRWLVGHVFFLSFCCL
jgi:hypothetical protein